MSDEAEGAAAALDAKSHGCIRLKHGPRQPLAAAKTEVVVAMQQFQARARGTGLSRWQVVLRLCLLLVAWQGPIPWVHAHGTLANSAETAAAWLGGHLQTHHAAIGPFADVFLGWHWHVDYPSSGSGDESRQQEQERLPARGCTSEVLLAAGQGGSGWWHASCAETALPAEGQRVHPSASSAHFWDSFAPSLALPVRLGTMRC